MHKRIQLVGLLLLALNCPAQITHRQSNTTLNLPPSLPFGNYELIDATPGSSFGSGLVHLAAPPDATNQLFVVEQHGIIRRIDHWATPPRTTNTFLDITDRVRSVHGEEGLLGLAFHPNYATNGWFFVFYTAESATPDHWLHDDILSRFTRDPNNPDIADPASEVILFRQSNYMWGVNHNAGDLHFGPDGYLYLSLGDGGYDQQSQIIDGGFFGGIIRIDVDQRPENIPPPPHTHPLGPYRIPADNPFVNATTFNGLPINTNTLRTEFFATGLRNPWRMSVDPLTGEILTGDVGAGDWEEINYILPGGNYGWPFREGPDPYQGSPPPGAVFIDPIHAYGRADGLSVIGGFIYRGTSLPELVGHYIYTDWANSLLYALLPQGTNPVTPIPLNGLGFGFGPTSIAPDPSNRDILVTRNGWYTSIERLVRSAPPTNNLPLLLSQTGAFSNLATLEPHPGIHPYHLNLPFWSDGALKTRWVSLPNTNLTFGLTPHGPWTSPPGAIWIKHFDLELTNGIPASSRRIETRFLVRTETGAYGLSYRWNEDQTDAELIDEAGLSVPVTVFENEQPITFNWRFPSRSECLSCHTPQAGHALGFSTEQWNRDLAYGIVTANQIQAFAQMGYGQAPNGPAIAWPRLAHPEETEIDIGFRARSYLQANCVYCHGNGGVARWDAQWFTPLEHADIIEANLNRILDNPTDKIIARGEPARSMLLNRINRRGPHQMPPLASERIDTQAVALITTWILALADYQTYPEWTAERLPGQPPHNLLPDADPDQDGIPNHAEWKLNLDPLDPNDPWRLIADPHGNLTYTRPAGMWSFIHHTEDLQNPDWRILDHPANAWHVPATPDQPVIPAPHLPPSGYYRLISQGP
ncbi:MAG TPA: PQQ-dependent sugar dehydrogenase [Kiritimatiellia bacterium]|nr:PQQ-dependent sugar dehydrogenase [Kiritimatiellia bacterium]